MSKARRKKERTPVNLNHVYTLLNPVSRALMVNRWKTDAVEGQIHALIGGDGLQMVNGAGRVFFVVLTAAVQQGEDVESPDMRILRGAIEALHEQAEDQEVSEICRAGILSGLNACSRILPSLRQRSLADAALEMEVMLANGDVRYSDFTDLIHAAKETSHA